MFEKLKKFWDSFWNAFKTAYNNAFKEPIKELVQDYRDTEKINFLAIFTAKLNNLCNIEATFDIESDSAFVEPLQELIKDIEENRFEITSEMLAVGDCWIFPSTDSEGKLYHRYLTQNEVRILNTDGEKLTDVIGIIDKYMDSNNKVYFLNRRHTLVGNSLTIETYTTNEDNKRCTLDMWTDYESIFTFNNVDNIGVGRFKSPTSSRGKSVIYGVPLNYGCKEIEDRIFNDLSEIETELKNNKSILFADPLILRKKLDVYTNGDGKKVSSDGWEIPENLFPIDTRGGQTGANIDIFAPEYRFSQLYEKLEKDFLSYEHQIGIDKGFLSEYSPSNTATEVKRNNVNTMAVIDKIRNSLDIGIESTIKADCIFLNISEDMYSIKLGWTDVFEDMEVQGNRLKEAAKDGFAEDIDYMQWLFPNMDITELREKLDRIKEAKQQNLVDFNLQNVNSTEKTGGNPFETKKEDDNPKEEPKEDKKEPKEE